MAAGGRAVPAFADSFAKPPGIKPPSGGADLDRWQRALAAARLYAIVRLHDYSAAGRFPRNHRIFGRTPVFIDEHATPCAVGYLMQQSGSAALASEIAATNNHVYIEHIKDGPAHEWMLLSGLTKEECAQIQPSYRRPPIVRPIDVPDEPSLEQQQLQQHFARLETSLIASTTASLKTAIARLEPMIAAGASIERVAR